MYINLLSITHKILWLVGCLFLLVSSSAWSVPNPPKPLSGLNIEGFQEILDGNVWQNNPFIRSTEQVSAQNLKLMAIIYNEQDAAALISGRVVRVGDKIGSIEIVSIGRTAVVLRDENEGKVSKLLLSEIEK